MSLTANALGTLMFAYSYQQTGTTAPDIANAPAAHQQWIANSITKAIQAMHGAKPDAWRRRPGITLVAPITGTATVTTGSTAVTLGTLTVPNDGCTVRFSSGIDNEINSDGSGGWQLRRPHDGLTGTLQATLWHDCWPAADGVTYENILGDVLANEVKIIVAATLDEVELNRFSFPWFDYGRGSAQTRLRLAGRVLAVVFEPWANPNSSQIQTRLRFTPMPDAQTVIDANLQVASQVITVANLLATSPYIYFQTPAHLDESILQPIAMKKWSSSPFFRTDDARKGIDEEYKEALNRLRDFAGQQDARPRVIVHGW